MLIKRLSIFYYFILLIFPVTFLYAENPLGVIVYIEGKVHLQRDGDFKELSGADLGQKLYNFDLIETSHDGFVEIEMSGFSKRGTIINVENDTTFYLIANPVTNTAQMNMYLITGSLSFKVEKLVGAEELLVRTESALIKVQGTDFSVQRAIDGSILVSCVEGKVTCSDDQKITRYALPGSVVEKRPGNTLTRIDIDIGYEKLYGEYWKNKREEIFKSGAETFIKAYSNQYNSYLPRFLEAYDNLLSVKNTLEKYAYEKQPQESLSSNLLYAKAETTDEIILMRSIMPLFENCFYAVQLLKDYYDEELSNQASSEKAVNEEFFSNFVRRRGEIKNKLADVRYCIKLYSNLSNDATKGSFSAADVFGDSFNSF